MAPYLLLLRVVQLAAIVVFVTVLVMLGFVGLGLTGLLMGLLLSGTLPLTIGLFLIVCLLVAGGLNYAFYFNPIAVILTTLGLFLAVAVVGELGLAILVVAGILIITGLIYCLGPSTIPPWVFFALLAALLVLPLISLPPTGFVLCAVALSGAADVVFFYLWIFIRMHRLPLRLLGLGAFTDMPAVPFRFADLPESVVLLKNKGSQEQSALNALTNQFTLHAGAGTITASAFDFMFGQDSMRSLSLDAPEQYAMGWNTLGGLDRRAAPLLANWTAGLTDANAATAQFWPNFARYFAPFGLVPMRKIQSGEIPALQKQLGSHWQSPAMDSPGTLYVIDMSIFDQMDPPTAAEPRFTPATVTYLVHDPAALTFTPVLIKVSNGESTHFYVNSLPDPNAPTSPADPVAASTWLYALHAAKTSIAVWGIWLGHVYKTHMVTAPMQMTMFRILDRLHPVRQILGRQSQYLIAFDLILALDWSFPPPTSLANSIQFLKICNLYAGGGQFSERRDGNGNPFADARQFFEDDPPAMLATLGLAAADFRSPTVMPSEIDLPRFAAKLSATPPDPASARLIMLNSAFVIPPSYDGGEDPPLRSSLAAALSTIITTQSPSLAASAPSSFGPSAITITPATQALLDRESASLPTGLSSTDTALLNRMLLQDAYPGRLKNMDWNLFPVARYLLEIFSMSQKYVDAVVDEFYSTDSDVTKDRPLQAWIRDSRNTRTGNVRGLPSPTDRATLKSILTSLIYRITAHGIARMPSVADPALSFAGLFPFCLEDSRLPDPDDPNGDESVSPAPTAPPTPLSTAQFLKFLPNTGTIGEVLKFLFAFTYAPPYKPFIPVAGNNTAGGPDREKAPFAKGGANAALDTFRDDLKMFIHFFMADSNDQNFLASLTTAPTAPVAQMNFQATPQVIHQWELNIET